jgi:hypothetical protein
VFAGLTYNRSPGTEVCPGEPTFRSELTRRLGSDPFTPNPEGIAVGDIRVILTKVPGAFVARYEWTGSPEAMPIEGRWEEPGRTRRDCYDALVGIAVDLAGSFVVFELEYGRKYAPKKPELTCSASPEPAPCPTSRFDLWPPELPMPPLEKPKPDPPTKPDRAPLAVRFGVAVGPELVALGWGSLGLTAGVGVRYRAVSFGVEAHGDPSLGTLTYPEGNVRFARASGALLACAHLAWFVGCGVGDVGRLLFPDHAPALPAAAFYGAAGVRTGLEAPVVPSRLFLRTTVDLLAPIHPKSYVTAHDTLFQVAGPGVGLGLGLVLELPP